MDGRGAPEGILAGAWMWLRRLGVAPALLGILAGLALCGLGYLAISVFAVFTPRQPDMRPVASAICADLTGQRYDDLYTRLDPALQAQGTAAQFAASQRELDQLQGAVTACSTATSSTGSGQGAITFTLTRASSPQPATATAALTADGATWRISGYTGAF